MPEERHGKGFEMDKRQAGRSPRRAPTPANAADEAADKATRAGGEDIGGEDNATTIAPAADLARAGVEGVRHAAEQHGLQLHEAAVAAGKAGRKAGREMAGNAQEGAATLARSGQKVAMGLQDVGRIWTEFMQEGMRESIAATQSLLRARSLSEAMQIQSEYLRNSFELLLDTTAEISDLSKQILSVTPYRALSGAGPAQASRH